MVTRFPGQRRPLPQHSGCYNIEMLTTSNASKFSAVPQQGLGVSLLIPMTPIEITLLTTAGGLLGFLLFRFWQRVKVPIVHERQWIGHGFDPGLITDRIEKLRSDYLSVVRFQRRAPGFHAELAATTRRMVAHLGFFRDRRAAGMQATFTAEVTREMPD